METRRRSRFLFIALAVLFALGAGIWIWLPLDEDPPPDADLREPRSPVPDAENGFLALSAHFHLLEVPEAERKARDPFGEGWDKEIAEATLARNAAALRGFEVSLRSPSFRAPETFLANPDGRPFGKFAELVSIRIKVLFDRGSEKEAFEEALRLLDYGHRLEGSEGTPLLFIHGQTAKGRARGALREMLFTTTLPRAELASFLDRSEGFPLHQEGWRELVRSQYRFVCQTIEEHPRTKKRSWVSRTIWKPNRTKRMFAETARRVLQGEAVLRTDGGVWWPPTNVEGRALHRLLSQLFQRLADYRRREMLFHPVPRVLFALRCYQEDRGALPSSLDALVPGYLEKLPADPDGRPFKYSAEHRTLQAPGGPPVSLGF